MLRIQWERKILKSLIMKKAANKELADPDSVAGKLLSCKG